MSAIRILHYGCGAEYYGTESVILNLYRHIDKSRFQFDFLVDHKFQEIGYEREIESLGGHIYRQYYRFTEKNEQGYIAPDQFWEMHPEIQGGIHLNLQAYGVWNTQLIAAAQRKGLPIRIIHIHNAPRGRALSIKTGTQHMFVRPYAWRYGNERLACSQKAGIWGYAQRCFQVFPNAIDVEQFAFDQNVRNRMREEHGLTNKLALGFVGRLGTQKNPEFLLKVLQEVNKRCSCAELILLGDGDLEQKLRRNAKKMGLENISFQGKVNNVHEWMQAFDVLLLPSRFEGLGVVLIEAQASGLACFASEQVPVEAAVTSRLSYLSLRDPAAWADAILKTDLSYDRRKGWEEVAAAGYDIRGSAKCLEAIYDKLLEQNR